MDKKVVRAILKKHKTTLKAVASKIGVTPTTTSQWVNNVKQPSRKNMKSFCKILRITPVELYGGVSQENFLKEKEIDRLVSITGTVQAAGKIIRQRAKKLNLPKELLIRKNKHLICVGDSMKTICKDGDLISYNENLEVENDDLVVVEIKNYGRFFKRFTDLTMEGSPNLTKEMIKKLEKKEHIYMFSSITPSKKYPPLLCGSNEVVSIYKVTGICYR